MDIYFSKSQICFLTEENDFLSNLPLSRSIRLLSCFLVRLVAKGFVLQHDGRSSINQSIISY